MYGRMFRRKRLDENNQNDHREENLVDLLSEYQKALDALTIDDEEEVIEIQKNQDEQDLTNKSIEELQKICQEMKKNVDERVKENTLKNGEHLPKELTDYIADQVKMKKAIVRELDRRDMAMSTNVVLNQTRDVRYSPSFSRK